MSISRNVPCHDIVYCLCRYALCHMLILRNAVTILSMSNVTIIYMSHVGNTNAHVACQFQEMSHVMVLFSVNFNKTCVACQF